MERGKETRSRPDKYFVAAGGQAVVAAVFLLTGHGRGAVARELSARAWTYAVVLLPYALGLIHTLAQTRSSLP